MNRNAIRTFAHAAILSLAAAAGGAAHADIVKVVLNGLPPGLTVYAYGTTCSFVSAAQVMSNLPKVTLAEQSTTVYDTVTVGAVTTLRQRVVTTYSAQFTVSPAANRCSIAGVDADYSFKAGIVGTTGKDSALRELTLGKTDSQPLIAYDFTLQAQTLSIHNGSSGLAGTSTLKRNQLAIVSVRLDDTLRAIDDAKLDLARTDDLAELLYGGVTLSINRAGRACIKAAGSLRCVTDFITPLVHGGISLTQFSLGPLSLGDGTVVTQAGFIFQPTLDFPPGSYRLTASANDVDLLAYKVDGVLQALDLLPWKPRSVVWTIQ